MYILDVMLPIIAKVWLQNVAISLQANGVQMPSSMTDEFDDLEQYQRIVASQWMSFGKVGVKCRAEVRSNTDLSTFDLAASLYRSGR